MRLSRPRSEDPPRNADVLTPETFLTSELLQRAQEGDRAALERILERYLPRLQSWAKGRLPSYARGLFDTGDLVQETLLRTMQGLDRVDIRPGGFQDYVRKAILNRIRDQIRWAARRRGSEEIQEDLADNAPSPLENAIGGDLLDAYERAMAALDEDDRRLLHLRIELGFDYGEIAAMTDRPSRDAARMALQRALARLTEAMGRESRE